MSISELNGRHAGMTMNIDMDLRLRQLPTGPGGQNTTGRSSRTVFPGAVTATQNAKNFANDVTPATPSSRESVDTNEQQAVDGQRERSRQMNRLGAASMTAAGAQSLLTQHSSATC